MKEHLLLAKVMLIALTLFMATPVWADMLVIDLDPPDTDTNPQRLPNSNPVTEEAWLEGLLGGQDVLYLGKDEKDWNDGIWSEWDDNSNIWVDSPSVTWTYAVLKYGVGKPSIDNPDHWAIVDDNDGIIAFSDISGLPALDRLSHTTYFEADPIPEPATVLLLGTGLLGITGFRKRLRKK